MRSLRLSASDLGKIERHAAMTYPHECCGILLGRGDSVMEVRETVNSTTLNPRTRYEIPVVDLLRAQTDARDHDLEVIGYYHSHPDHAAAPSHTDRADAWPGVSYLIVGVEKGATAEVASWRLEGLRGTFARQPVEVKP